MKRILFTLLLPVVCGAGGFCLRRQQLLTGFESTGLAVPGNLYAWLLIALSLVTAAACLLLCRQCRHVPQSYNEAFSSTGNAFYLFFVALAALLLLASGAVGLWSFVTQGGTWLELLQWCLCLASAVCVITVALGNFRYRGRRAEAGGRRENSLALLVLPYTVCLWLVTAYQEVSADPVKLNYVYRILAIICILLATYYIAGFSFQRAAPKRCLTFSLLGVYLSIVALADAGSWSTRLLLLASVLYLSHTALVLMINVVLNGSERPSEGLPDYEAAQAEQDVEEDPGQP